MTISEVRQTADDHTGDAVEVWQRREPALAAVAVLGIGPVATALAEATHPLVAEGAPLRLVADPEYLVVLGEEAALPWVEGARYLGWDGSALTLTTHRVLPAADLWREAALAAAGADPASLVIVLPDQVLIAGVDDEA
jgi:MoxR-vWA-beta-propeller ternary system domain bpX5